MPDDTGPGPLAAQPQVFPAMVNTPETLSDEAEPSTSTPQEPPADPSDQPPVFTSEYQQAVIPALPERMSWNTTALGAFLADARQTGMKPSVVKECLSCYAPTLVHLQEAVRAGQGLESALMHAAEGLKTRWEAKGATRPQIEAAIRAGVDWLERNLDAVFGSEHSHAPLAEELANIISIYRELSTLSKDDPRFGRLNAQALAWQRKHPRGYL